MARDVVRIDVKSIVDLGAELMGYYRVEDVGRTVPNRLQPTGFQVQTWRRETKDPRDQLTVHVVRVPRSDHRDFLIPDPIALTFWLAPAATFPNKYRFVVLEQLSSAIFAPSRRTYDYAVKASTWWNLGVAPVLGSHVDSLITS